MIVAPATLVGIVRDRSVRQPDRRAYTFLVDGEDEGPSLTYHELDRRARALAAVLEDAGAACERVLLLYPPGLDFITAFLGCLYARAIAVPAYPPHPARVERAIPRLLAIAKDARPAVALTTAAALAQFQRLTIDAGAWRAMRVLSTDDVDASSGDAWHEPDVRADDLAFLQYTSGSTGTPRGVMVTHGNLLHNSAALQQRMRLGADSCGVIWLPQYHDMGLIGGILQPLYSGFPIVSMSPFAFLQRPLRWLTAVSHYRATVSGGPNFAYDLCTARITPEEIGELDLGSWEIAFNGAEPVRAETLDRFAARFAPAGFRKEALFPCYGLAEGTLIVSGPAHRAEPAIFDAADARASDAGARARRIVGCGTSVAGQEIVIADPVSRARRGVGEVGEIWVSGPSVASGYWNRPSETEHTFGGFLAGEAHGPFLRTGDLGFLDADGTLAVTGRIKDLIIIRGQNHYPHDIEATAAASHPAVRPGGCAAFSVDQDGEERLAIAIELDRRSASGAPLDVEAVADAIRAAVADAHEVQVHIVALLGPGGVPKTSSGKIQRLACRSAFVAGELPVVAKSVRGATAAPEPVEEPTREWLMRLPAAARRDALHLYLQQAIAAAARCPRERVRIDEPLNALGLDSLAAIDVAARIERALGVRFPLARLAQEGAIASLADELLAHLEAQADGAEGLPAIVPAPDARHEPFPLSDIQQAYWIGRSAGIELGNVSIHFYVELEGSDLDLARLEGAWRRVVERHDMLRAVVTSDGRQRVLESVPDYRIEVADLRAVTSEQRASHLDAERRRMSHQVFGGDVWPAFEIRASRIDGRTCRVHVSIDLLHIDGGSLMILFRDWARFYAAPDESIPPLRVAYRDYVLATEALRQTPAYQRSLEYWRSRLPELPPAPDLPLARTPASLAAPRFVRRRERIGRRDWDRFRQRASSRGVTPSAALLAAYAETLGVWSRAPECTINVTLFNRLPLHADIGDIVGDFTSLVLVDASAAAASAFELRASQLQRRLWEALEHRYVSGVQVLRELARARHHASSVQMPVVFTSLLNLQRKDLAATPASLHALGRIAYAITQTPQVWLDHQVHEDEGELVLIWDAVDDLFPRGLLDAMFSAYARLVRDLANTDYAWGAASHDLVPPDQLAARIVANATDTPVPNETLRSLWTRAAAEYADRTALVAGETSMSYRELRHRAENLARRIREHGAGGRDTLIPVVVDKSREQVVACLAVHGAGAAYVPIDPHVPSERLHQLLDDTGAGLVLTTAALDASLDWPDARARLLVNDETEPGAGREDLPGVAPADLSHVIYTSGSTGVPKGVMIEHRSVVNRVLDVNRRFKVGPGERALALTALHHDLSVYDIFGMLSAGGTIVVPEADRVRDPAHWAELMVRHGVTIWNSVPMFMEMLVEFLEHPSTPADMWPRALRLVLLAGDWIPVTLPGRIAAVPPGARLIAAGGPTETTIWDIAHPVEAVDPSWASIPYGRPMANARYHVVDDAFQPKPVWVPGELYIGGAGLARGYWRDEEKTRARFVAHPRTGERLYRSGDLGRYLPDGEIEFVGRSDFQVKIGGFRVELGEIEAHLQRHPDVRAAAVAAIGDTRGPKQLVAYVVPRSAAIATEAGGQSPSATAETSAPQQASHAAVRDATARLEFQLRQPGLRSQDGSAWIPLTPPAEEERPAHARRATRRTFASAAVSFDNFSRLLACLYGLRAETALLPKYRYPSAGSLYPVQTYVHVKPDRVEGLAAGIYYYHPVDHALVVLSPDAGIDAVAHFPHNRPAFEQSAFSLFLIGQLAAIEPMYGSFARDFCLVEAGAMCQLLMTVAPEVDLGLCPIGALDFLPIKDLFQLDDTHELLHSLIGGPLNGGDAAGASAHATSRDEPDPAARLEADLRRFLAQRIPEHMVPSAFVWLDTLPLTANGKLDRRALPMPQRTERADQAVEPRDELERTLTAIVREVLEIERVGVYENLFQAGANSLHVIQIHNRLRDALDRDVAIAALFTHPTIASLAQHLRGEERPR